MKKIKLSLVCFSISLLLMSCGSKNSENGSTDNAVVVDPKAFHDKIDSHVDKSENSYYTFTESLVAEDKNDVTIAYDNMLKTFDTEKGQLVALDIAAGGEDKTLSQNFKDAAIKYIDVYIEAGKKELLDIKNLALQGKAESEEAENADLAFSEKIGEVNSPYRKVRKEFKAKHNIVKQ